MHERDAGGETESAKLSVQEQTDDGLMSALVMKRFLLEGIVNWESGSQKPATPPVRGRSMEPLLTRPRGQAEAATCVDSLLSLRSSSLAAGLTLSLPVERSLHVSRLGYPLENLTDNDASIFIRYYSPALDDGPPVHHPRAINGPSLTSGIDKASAFARCLP